MTITYRTPIEAITIRLKPGDDLKLQLDQVVAEQKIKAGCILSCAGSLDRACIRFANQPTADTLPGKFEIVSLSGTLAMAGSHIHISVSDSTGKTIGGHLKEGSIIYTTAEIVIGVMPSIEYNREVDSTYGYKELIIRKQ